VKAEASSALKQAGVDFVDRNRRSSAPANGSASPVDGATAGEGPGGSGQPTRSEDPADARAQPVLHRATVARILAAVVTTSETRADDDPAFARLIFHAMSRSGFNDAISDTVKRRGLEHPKSEAPGSTLARHAESLDANRLRSLILELALARGAYFAWSSTYSEDLIAAAATYEIDIHAIAKATADELGAKRAERVQKKERKATAMETSSPAP
jgi:hypothetical protein